MRAARFPVYGSPDVLVVEDAPEPHAGVGAVRVAVQAASVNPIDVLLRAGRLAEFLPLDLPAIPGRDAVGVVDEVGEGVTDAKVGDVVFGLGGVSDTTAEFAVLTAWSPVPEQWTTAQAAAAGLAGATAAAAIEMLGDLAGSTILVEGASGAVGTAVAAFAAAAGATVVGTGRESSHAALRAIGVIPTTYGVGLADRVAALAPGGVDVAVHCAPSDSLGTLVAIVGDASRVVTVVDHQGAVQYGALQANARNESALLRRGADLARAGGWTPHVDQEFALEDIARAHSAAETGHGKIVVTVV